MMKKLIVILVLIISQISSAQNGMFSGDDYARVYVEAGFVQPLGKLSNKFELAPSFGFWFRNKITHEEFLDVGFNFFIPKKPVDASFVYQDSIAKYKSKHFAINIGSRFAKIIKFSDKNQNFNLELNTGAGLALNFYKAPESLEFEDGEHSKETLATFYLAQGIKLNYKNTGLQCHYQWSPYGLFNDKLEKDFGSQSLMFGIVYRQ